MEDAFNTVITLLIQLTIVAVMVSVGLQITGSQIVTAVSRKGLMAKALLANIILIPLIAVLLAQLFNLPQEIAIGFLLVSATPGATLIPKYAEIAGADLPFSVGLLFFLALLTIVTTPITAGLILPARGDIEFDVLRVITILVIFQLIPLLIGLGIHRRRQQLAGRLLRPSILLSNLLVLLVIVLIVIRDFQALLALPWLAIAAMVLLIVIMLSIGWALGGPDIATRRALALGTSAQFSALALLITSTNFPDTDADIAVVAFGLLILVINTAVALFWHRQKSTSHLKEPVRSA